MIGKYTVTVQNEIQVPDNAEKTSYTTMTATSTFDITVQPCIVDQYVSSIEAGQIQYVIGSTESVKGGAY